MVIFPFGKEVTGPGKQMKHDTATLIETITSDFLFPIHN